MLRFLIHLKTNFLKLSNLKDSSYFICLIILLLIVFIMDFIVYYVELPEENTINSVSDIIWWNIVTLTTVGYGDMYPTTLVGKLATIIIMFSGIATVAYLLSGVVEYVVAFNQRRELGLLRVKMEAHIVICNWNERTLDLIDQLKKNGINDNELVIIDNALETRPLNDVAFIKGSPSDIEILKKASVEKANKVLILARMTEKSNADATTVLTALAVKSLSPDVFVCAEILDHNNIIFLKNAHVDQIIEINSIVSRFTAQSVSDPKLQQLLQDIVSIEEHSCEIYRVKIPDSNKGDKFIDFLNQTKLQHNCTVVAIEDPKTGDYKMNPESDKELNADYCYVIASSRPVLS